MRFNTPFNMMVNGASQSGKTFWVKNLLSNLNTIFPDGRPDRIILFYNQNQDLYHEMKNLNLIDELININENPPDLDALTRKIQRYTTGKGSIIIFDDVLTNIHNQFEDIFCNLSHHSNCSMIFLSQNIFYNQKAYRTMSLNTHYMIIMSNPRDTQQISILAKQFKPDNVNFVVKSYKDATERQFGYILLDFGPTTLNKLRIRTNIFPQEAPMIVYVENE